MLFAPLVLVACAPPVEQGQLTVCSTVEISDQEQETVISGSVTGIDDGAVDCARSLTVTDATGDATTIGLTLLDAGGVDVTPPFDLDLEDMVSFSHHYVMVWGDAEGFVIEDDLG